MVCDEMIDLSMFVKVMYFNESLYDFPLRILARSTWKNWDMEFMNLWTLNFFRHYILSTLRILVILGRYLTIMHTSLLVIKGRM